MGDVLCVLSKVQVSQIDEDGIWPSPLQRAVKQSAADLGLKL